MNTVEFELDFLNKPLLDYELDLLDTLLSFQENHGKIHSLFHLSNCKSVARVCNLLKIQVAFWEGAPLRGPFFDYHLFVDVNGVGGNTSSTQLLAKFYTVKYRDFCSIFSLEDLRYLVMSHSSDWDTVINNNSNTVRTGVALQVEVDNNIINFSNGWDTIKLMDFARLAAGYDEVLIRRHPLGIANYDCKYGVIDTSSNSLSFLTKIQSLLTINSSVAFESALLGMPTYILGSSPFDFLSNGGATEFYNFCNQGEIIKDTISNRAQFLSALIFGIFCPEIIFLKIDSRKNYLDSNLFSTKASFVLRHYFSKFNFDFPEKTSSLVDQATILKNLIRPMVEINSKKLSSTFRFLDSALICD